MPYLEKNIIRLGEKCRSDYPALETWEECCAQNVHLHCLPASVHNVPTALLPYYLEPLLQKCLLAGKRNFIFLQHNVSKPCAFFDCAFRILQRKKQEHTLCIVGAPEFPGQSYAYDASIPMGSRGKMNSVFYYALSKTADTLLCDISKAGHSAILPVARFCGVRKVNINALYHRDMHKKPERVLLGDDARAQEIYYRIRASLGGQDTDLLHELLARVKQPQRKR